jgi:hypothetical protein
LLVLTLLAAPEQLAPERTVTLNAVDQPLDLVLMDLTKQTGWGLVIDAPMEIRKKKVTLALTNKPATEVVETLERLEGFDIDLEGQTLMVVSDEEVGQMLKIKTGSDDPNERVMVGSSLVIEANEEVEQAVVIDGSLTIKGKVRGDATVIGGSLVVEPGGKVGGEVVSIGGSIDVRPGAEVGGDKVSIGGEGLGGLISKLVSEDGAFDPHMLAAMETGWTVMHVIMLLLVGALVISFAPERVRRVRDTLLGRPGASFGAGIALLVGFLPMCVMLALTVIGIPLIFAAFAGLALVLAVGITTLMSWIGARLPIAVGKKGPFGEVMLGAAVLALIDFVPLGTPLIILASFVAAGAVLLSRLGAGPRSSLPVPAAA